MVDEISIESEKSYFKVLTLLVGCQEGHEWKQEAHLSPR